MQRVAINDPAATAIQAQLWAARGEYESFQIIVRAPPSGLSNVNIAVSDLQGPSGQIISHKNLTLYREKYVYVSKSSPDRGGSNRPLGPGWYPDALIPFVDPNTGADLVGATLHAVPFSLAANTNQPVWVDVFVPRTAAAGVYTGTFTVTSAQGRTRGQIALTVWNFTLPLQPSLKSSFQVYAPSLPVYEELLRNKVSPTKVKPATYERSLIDEFGLSSTHLGFWSGATYGNCTMSSAPSVADVQRYITYHERDLYIYNYTADEIWKCTHLFNQLKQWARSIHQGGSRQLVTMAPVQALLDDGSGTGRSAVDIWVMLPSMYDSSTTLVAQALHKGDAAWSYNAMVQDSYSPKWEIDFDPINYRIQPGFISQSLHLTGLLYWRIDRWSSDPWTDVNNVGVFSDSGPGENYPGEGMLVYPGQQVGITGVAPSMRLKWLRDGVEDYEYVEMLKKAGRGDWALQLAASVGANWSNWTRDPNALAAVRKQLGNALDSLSSRKVSEISLGVEEHFSGRIRSESSCESSEMERIATERPISHDPEERHPRAGSFLGQER